MYPYEFVLESEGTPVECICLGAKMTVTGEGLLNIVYHNKNAESLATHGTQRYPRFQHGLSFAPKSQKLATIIGELHRVDQMTLKREDKIQQLHILIKEFESINIPPKMLKQAIQRSDIETFVETLENWGSNGPPMRK